MSEQSRRAIERDYVQVLGDSITLDDWHRSRQLSKAAVKTVPLPAKGSRTNIDLQHQQV